jgi:hypothetical protein
VDEAQRDLDLGYVTAESAESDYGCVLVNGRIDSAATAARRVVLKSEGRPS